MADKNNILPYGFIKNINNNKAIYWGKVIDNDKVIFLSFIGIVLSAIFVFSFQKYLWGIGVFIIFGAYLWISLHNKIVLTVFSDSITLSKGYKIFSKSIKIKKNDFISAKVEEESTKSLIGFFLYGSNPTKSTIKKITIQTKKKKHTFFCNLKSKEKLKLVNLINLECKNVENS